VPGHAEEVLDGGDQSLLKTLAEMAVEVAPPPLGKKKKKKRGTADGARQDRPLSQLLKCRTWHAGTGGGHAAGRRYGQARPINPARPDGAMRCLDPRDVPASADPAARKGRIAMFAMRGRNMN